MNRPTVTEPEPAAPPDQGARWKCFGRALLRYGAVYSIFGVVGVAFLLIRALNLLIRGPGDSGI